MDLNVSSLTAGASLVVTATYGAESEQTTPITNSIVALAFDAFGPLNAATASTYSVFWAL